jgi:hypothetical protein
VESLYEKTLIISFNTNSFSSAKDEGLKKISFHSLFTSLKPEQKG